MAKQTTRVRRSFTPRWGRVGVLLNRMPIIGLFENPAYFSYSPSLHTAATRRSKVLDPSMKIAPITPLYPSVPPLTNSRELLWSQLRSTHTKA